MLSLGFPNADHIHGGWKSLSRQILHRLNSPIYRRRTSVGSSQALQGNIKRRPPAFGLLVEPESREPEVHFDGCQNLHWFTILYARGELPSLDCCLRPLVQSETQGTYHSDVGWAAFLIDN